MLHIFPYHKVQTSCTDKYIELLMVQTMFL